MAKQESPKQMRITDETMDQIRSIAQEIGGTQQDVMTRLLQMYQAEKTGEEIPDKKDEVERFRGYLDTALQMYLSLQRENSSAASSARAECGVTITALEDQVAQLKAERDDAARKADESRAAMEKETARAGEMDTRLRETLSILEDRKRTIDVLEKRVADIQASAARAEELEKKNQDMSDQVRGLKGELSQIKLDHSQELLELRMAHSQEMRAAADDFQARMDALREEHQRQISQYQAEYRDLFRQFMGGAGNGPQGRPAASGAAQASNPTASPVQGEAPDALVTQEHI